MRKKKKTASASSKRSVSSKRPAKKTNRRRKSSRRGRKPIFILILLAIFAVSALLGYALMSNQNLRDSFAYTVNSVWRAITDGIDDDPIIPTDGEAVIHFLDVGQGDSALIQTTRGSVLIDGGDNHMGERVADYLRRAGIVELTYVIATHPHADHIGGLIEVLNQFPVGTLIMPPVAHTTVTFERFLDAIEDNNIPLREPILGSTFNIGDAIFTIIAPNSAGYDNLNDYSVSLRMTFGSTGFIFTGDAEALSEGEMLAAGHNLSADVLYVGHHGSTTSTTQEFLDAVSPSIAVISAGAGNSYGHPHNTVMSRLRVAGIRIYRTDHHGNIIIVSDGANLRVYHD